LRDLLAFHRVPQPKTDIKERSLWEIFGCRARPALSAPRGRGRYIIHAMNHASKDDDTRHLPLNHDPTSKLPSKSSQPPLKMSRKPNVDTDWNSPDTRIYYAKKYRQTLSSAPACALAVIAGAPLENVKVRMQSRYFPNAYLATKHTYRTEGIRGFWAGKQERGLGPSGIGKET